MAWRGYCVQCGKVIPLLEWWISQYTPICNECMDKVNSLRIGDRVRGLGRYEGVEGELLDGKDRMFTIKRDNGEKIDISMLLTQKV